jgi:hypothetical protein
VNNRVGFGKSVCSVINPARQGRGATVTRYERLKAQRRMQRRIRLVVEERRLALALPAGDHDPDATVEITPRAIGRVPASQI